METAGLVASVVSLTAIWKTCLFAFNKYEESRRYDTDVKILLVKLQVQQVRIWQWADTLGYTDPSRVVSLDSPLVESTVNNILACIKQSLEDTESLRNNYGITIEDTSLRTTTGPSRVVVGPVSVDAVDVVFSHPATRLRAAALIQEQTRSSNLTQRTKWVVRDKAKFELLVHELKGFVDSLYGIINPEARRSAQRSLQQQIDSSEEVGSLQVLQQAAGDDDDHISISVSKRLTDLRSSANSRRSSFYAIPPPVRRYRDTFWGDSGFETLERQAELHQSTGEALEKFWTQRIAADRQYAKALREISQAAVDIGYQEAPPIQKHIQHAIECTSMQANALLSFALRLDHDVLMPCKEMTSKMGNIQGKLEEMEDKLESTRKQRLDVQTAQKDVRICEANVQWLAEQVEIHRGSEKTSAREQLKQEQDHKQQLLDILEGKQKDRDNMLATWATEWLGFCDEAQETEQMRLSSLAAMSLEFSEATRGLVEKNQQVAEGLLYAGKSFSSEEVLNDFISHADQEDSVSRLNLSESPSNTTRSFDSGRPGTVSRSGSLSSSMKRKTKTFEKVMEYVFFGPG